VKQIKSEGVQLARIVVGKDLKDKRQKEVDVRSESFVFFFKSISVIVTWMLLSECVSFYFYERVI
jgi:hypothetical protein